MKLFEPNKEDKRFHRSKRKRPDGDFIKINVDGAYYAEAGNGCGMGFYRIIWARRCFLLWVI